MFIEELKTFFPILLFKKLVPLLIKLEFAADAKLLIKLDETLESNNTSVLQVLIFLEPSFFIALLAHFFPIELKSPSSEKKILRNN